LLIFTHIIFEKKGTSIGYSVSRILKLESFSEKKMGNSSCRSFPTQEKTHVLVMGVGTTRGTPIQMEKLILYFGGPVGGINGGRRCKKSGDVGVGKIKSRA